MSKASEVLETLTPVDEAGDSYRLELIVSPFHSKKGVYNSSEKLPEKINVGGISFRWRASGSGGIKYTPDKNSDASSESFKSVEKSVGKNVTSNLKLISVGLFNNYDITSFKSI